MKLKSITTKKTTKKEPKFENTSKAKTRVIPHVPFSLGVEISKNYEGMSDNILGVINSLHPVPKTFFQNMTLQRAKVSPGVSEFFLDNAFYLKITKTKLGRRHMDRIVLKRKKEVVFNALIPRT